MRELNLHQEKLVQDHVHQEIFDLLAQEGGEGRFVGGIVRDALLGQPTDDYDMATTHSPETLMRLFTTKGLSVIPTGLAHGTVTVPVKDRVYQITTLRRDVATDGRHARIEFSSKWEEDAKRRDFTMNALYLDAQGRVWDFFDGLEDLRQGRVRFIGDPFLRLEEDYLRLLRFFRFHATYALTPLDQAGLEACIFYKDKVLTLSKERVTQEFFKLLKASCPEGVLGVLVEKDLLPSILGSYEFSWSVMRTFFALEKALDFQALPLVRLCALLWGEENDTVPRLVFSRVERHLFKALRDQALAFSLVDGDPLLSPGLSEVVRSFGWQEGKGFLMLSAARMMDQSDLTLASATAWLRKMFFALDQGEIPFFPLMGRDLIDAGCLPGKGVGILLEEMKAWWIAHHYPSRNACLEELDRRMASFECQKKETTTPGEEAT